MNCQCLLDLFNSCSNLLKIGLSIYAFLNALGYLSKMNSLKSLQLLKILNCLSWMFHTMPFPFMAFCAMAAPPTPPRPYPRPCFHEFANSSSIYR